MHMPSGLLKENDCGDSSGRPTPQVGQARGLAVGALALLALDDGDHRPAAGLHRGLDRVGEAGPALGVDGQAVDHDLDVVLLLLVERRHVLEPLDEAVDAHPHEAGLARLLEDVAELALAVLGLGGQQRHLGLGGQLVELVDDLGGRAGGHRPPHRWQRCSPTRA
jgi:hypothetical protein